MSRTFGARGATTLKTVRSALISSSDAALILVQVLPPSHVSMATLFAPTAQPRSREMKRTCVRSRCLWIRRQLRPHSSVNQIPESVNIHPEVSSRKKTPRPNSSIGICVHVLPPVEVTIAIGLNEFFFIKPPTTTPRLSEQKPMEENLISSPS